MKEKIKKLSGANMDIDLYPNVKWKIEKCPWNESEGVNVHKCAVKNVSLCKYFRGIEYLDTVLCIYPSNDKSDKK